MASVLAPLVAQVVDSAGNARAGVNVRVYHYADGVLGAQASAFTDDTGAHALSQPHATDSDGFASFWLPRGLYAWRAGDSPAQSAPQPFMATPSQDGTADAPWLGASITDGVAGPKGDKGDPGNDGPTGARGPSGIRATQPTAPDTAGWAVGELWYDTSTET